MKTIRCIAGALADQECSQVLARLVASQFRKTPHALSERRDQRLVLVFPGNSFAGQDIDTLSLLRILGHNTAKLESVGLPYGLYFHLIRFAAQGHEKIAHWHHVIQMVCSAYPEVAHHVRHVAWELMRTPYEQFEAAAGFSFAAVDDSGEEDPLFMTTERLRLSRGEAWQVRAFLYHTVRLNELYRGDGFTRSPCGVRGVPEFLAYNTALSALRLIEE